MSNAAHKFRLDQWLVSRGLVENIAKARAWIMSGYVFVNEHRQTKPGTMVDQASHIDLRPTVKHFVSRGGDKLCQALHHWQLEVKDWLCLDVGASTGGFTDCLLQAGAQKILAIDVGRAQLHERLRHDPRVVMQEGMHANQLRPQLCHSLIGNLPDIAVVDVSFISLIQVIPSVMPCVKIGGHIIALIKPQFEALPNQLIKGVVRHETTRQEIIAQLLTHGRQHWRLDDIKTHDAAIKGAKGNQETFLWGRRPHS